MTRGQVAVSLNHPWLDVIVKCPAEGALLRPRVRGEASFLHHNHVYHPWVGQALTGWPSRWPAFLFDR